MPHYRHTWPKIRIVAAAATMLARNAFFCIPVSSRSIICKWLISSTKCSHSIFVTIWHRTLATALIIFKGHEILMHTRELVESLQLDVSIISWLFLCMTQRISTHNIRLSRPWHRLRFCDMASFLLHCHRCIGQMMVDLGALFSSMDL